MLPSRFASSFHRAVHDMKLARGRLGAIQSSEVNLTAFKAESEAATMLPSRFASSFHRAVHDMKLARGRLSAVQASEVNITAFKAEIEAAIAEVRASYLKKEVTVTAVAWQHAAPRERMVYGSYGPHEPGAV